jgi:hypothetical protein
MKRNSSFSGNSERGHPVADTIEPMVRIDTEEKILNY